MRRPTLPLHRLRLLLRPLLPRRAQPLATRAVLAAARVWLRGDGVSCPCCGRSFRRFLAYPSLLCPGCGSYERHRAFALLDADRGGLVRPGARVLHVGPERALQPFLRRPGVDYVAVDLDHPLATHAMDVRALTFPDASFDVAVCLHVLERAEDVPAAAGELVRVVRPGGLVVAEVPERIPGLPEELARALAERGVRADAWRVADLPEPVRRRHGLDAQEVVYLGRRE